MVADNIHYIEWYTCDDQVKEFKLDSERHYEPEIWEYKMNITIYTKEEQEKNFQDSMTRIEKHAENYSELAKAAKDVMAATNSAKEAGDFLFPYNEETKKNKASEFWDRYRELKQVHVDRAIAEIQDLIKSHDTVYMLIKVKKATNTIQCLNGDAGAPLRAEAQAKIDTIMAAA